MAFNKGKALADAQKQVSQGKLKEAAGEYLKIHKQDPRDQNALNTLGDLNVRLKNIPEALNYYTKLADMYVSDGFLVRGIAMYKKISKLDPGNVTAMERLADLYTMQGLIGEARSQYMQLAEGYLKANNPSKAMEVMNKVLDLDPENTKIQQRLADLYERHNQGAQAADIYRRLADRSLQSDQMEEALKWVEKAAALAPENHEVLLLRAQLQQRQGKAAEALATLEKIPDLERHPEALHTLLKARLDAGDTGAAEELAEKLFAADAQNFSGLLQLARHATGQGQMDRALELLRRVSEPALVGDPSHFSAVAREVSAALADSVEAAELFAQGARQGGDTSMLAEALSRLGDLAQRSDDLQRAKRAYDELASLQPENPEFSQKLKTIREQLGEPVVTAEAPEAPAGFAEVPAAPPGEPLDEETQAYLNASMTDIDLFSSYGMTEKAVELAQQVIARVPRHVPVLEKLLDFYVGSGNDRGVAEMAGKLEPLYRQQGNNDRAEEMKQMAERYGEKVGLPPAPAEPAAEAAASSGPELHEVDLSAEWASAAGLEEATEAPAEMSVEAPAGAFNVQEATEEIEFYLSQGLSDQARAVLERYEQQFPGEAALGDLRARVEGTGVPAETAPAEAPAEEPAPAAAEEEQTYEVTLEPQEEKEPAAAGGGMGADQFFSDLAGEVEQALESAAPPQVTDQAGPPQPKPAAAPPPPPPPSPAPAEEAPVGALAEVFEEFKQEMGEVEEVEDAETHYNLGIAYKEMGLLDEAISEFQKASKASEKEQAYQQFFQSCILLGHCFIDKNHPQIAVRWYERALKAPGLDEEGALALRYDLGAAHEQAGNRKAALDCYMEVYGVNVDYRNVGERIRELQGS